MYYDFFTQRILGPNVLLKLLLVVRNQGVGRADDALGAAVVLLQLIKSGIGVVILKIQNIADVGSPKGIDALGVVADYANILKAAGKCLDNEVLGVVGVLVLVDQQVAKPFLVFCQGLWKAGKKFVGLEQQVVKIHGARPKAALHVLAVDFAQLGHSGRGILLLEVGPCGISLGRN